MNGSPVIIERGGIPLGKVHGGGRPRGSGINLRLIESLAQGKSLWEIPPHKIASIRSSAGRYNRWAKANGQPEVRIKIRRQPDSPNYALWKL